MLPEKLIVRTANHDWKNSGETYGFHAPEKRTANAQTTIPDAIHSTGNHFNFNGPTTLSTDFQLSDDFGSRRPRTSRSGLSLVHTSPPPTFTNVQPYSLRNLSSRYGQSRPQESDSSFTRTQIYPSGHWITDTNKKTEHTMKTKTYIGEQLVREDEEVKRERTHTRSVQPSYGYRGTTVPDTSFKASYPSQSYAPTPSCCSYSPSPPAQSYRSAVHPSGWPSRDESDPPEDESCHHFHTATRILPRPPPSSSSTRPPICPQRSHSQVCEVS